MQLELEYTWEAKMTQSASAAKQRELPIYLGSLEPICTAVAEITYAPRSPTDDLNMLKDFCSTHRGMLAPGTGLKRGLMCWWLPRTKRWRELNVNLDAMLLDRIGTTEIKLVATRQLSEHETTRARIEYLLEVIKRARYWTWRAG